MVQGHVECEAMHSQLTTHTLCVIMSAVPPELKIPLGLEALKCSVTCAAFKGFSIFDMFNLIALGLLMGVTFAVPPGVVSAETLRRGVARGFRDALGVQLGSLIGDATYALLALGGLAFIVQQPITEGVLGILGSGYLLYIAVNGLKQYWVRANGATAPVADSQASAFRTGAMLSLTNPWAVGYWLALGSTLASAGVTASQSDAAVFFASFFAVCVAYAFAAALLAGFTRRVFSASSARLVSLACSVVIGALGLAFGARVLALWLAT